MAQADSHVANSAWWQIKGSRRLRGPGINLSAPRDGLFAATLRILRCAPDRRRYASASNFACGEVVEPGLSMSAVRIKTVRIRSPLRVLKPQFIGSPGRIRTADQRINSPSLYH